MTNGLVQHITVEESTSKQGESASFSFNLDPHLGGFLLSREANRKFQKLLPFSKKKKQQKKKKR